MEESLPETRPFGAPGASPEPHASADRAAAGSASGRPPLAYPGVRGQDPVIQWLMMAILAVIILCLAAVLSAIVFGLFNQNGAPRTEVEHELAFYSSKVQGGKADNETFALYVDALATAGQLSKANEALSQALRTAKDDKSYLYAEQARLLLDQKAYQQAVTAADKAMAEAQRELAAFKAANVAANRKANAGAVLADSYSTAALAKANALISVNDHAGAIKAFDSYLVVHADASDVLVARGQEKVRAGDKTGAAADFREALKYIPDFQPALDGLKQIGASK